MIGAQRLQAIAGLAASLLLVFSGMAMIMMGAATEAVVDEAERAGGG